MLSIEPSGQLGLSRRGALRAGILGGLGLNLADLARLRRASAGGPEGTARSCVFVFLFGGPSHIDLWDMKPNAPTEIRGEFRPIETNVPGVTLCEHLPSLARVADKLCLVRSATHHDRVHGTASSEMFTGRPHKRPGSTDQASPDDWPSISAMAMRHAPTRGGMPSSIVLPWYLRFAGQGERIAGQTGGLMGERHNAFLIHDDPSRAGFRVPAIELPPDTPPDRVRHRDQLLAQVEMKGAEGSRVGSGFGERGEVFGVNRRTAFSMIAGGRGSHAFALAEEPLAARLRYGDHTFGQSLLLARRLVEAGVSLVTVNWDDETRDDKVSPFWDTHDHNFPRLKDRLLPVFDKGMAAFLADLAERGLLDSTLVVVMGEFGRSPYIGKISQNNMTEKTGRDHWPHVFTVLVAGGGVRGGQIYGASDGIGACVRDDPVTPSELTATVLAHLGIDPRLRFRDPMGVAYELCAAEPVSALR